MGTAYLRFEKYHVTTADNIVDIAATTTVINALLSIITEKHTYGISYCCARKRRGSLGVT